MAKVYKYQVENELKAMKPIELSKLKKYLDKLTLKENKIIFFGNTNSEYYSYYCTYCQKWHFIKKKMCQKFKKGEYLTCVNCGKRFEVIYSHNIIEDVGGYITKIEVNKRKEIIFRIFFYRKHYLKQYGLFSEELLEIERINIDREVAMKCNTYSDWYYGLRHKLTGKGFTRDKTAFYKNYPCNNIVNNSIKRLIRDTSIKYSALDLAIKMGLDGLDYLITWKQYSKLELLVKAGCSRLLKDICKVGGYEYYRIPTLFSYLDKNTLNLLREHNLNFKEIEFYKKMNIRDIGYIKKAMNQGFNLDHVGAYKNLCKTIDYLDAKKYWESNYHDYLTWCDCLGMNLNDKRVLYPDDPKEAHDKAWKEIKSIKDKAVDQQIEVYASELEALRYKNAGLIIMPAHSRGELILESKQLNHCVRNYAEKMSKRKTSIFFIRKTKEETKPYVTLELNNGKVIQCRGKNDDRPKDSVIRFVNDWCRKNHFQSCFS